MDMFKTLGFLTQEVVDTWEEDLLTKGVYKGDGTENRLPVCKYDAANLSDFGKALLNSCSEKLKLHILNMLQVNNRRVTCLQITFQILLKCYRPSDKIVQARMKDLENLDIREFGGQNVQLFVQKALEFFAEIKLNV